MYAGTHLVYQVQEPPATRHLRVNKKQADQTISLFFVLIQSPVKVGQILHNDHTSTWHLLLQT